MLQDILSKDKDKKIKAVAVVHNETTTGVTSDIKGVRAAMDAADHPALLLVDGVSSIGALEFKFDDWGVDVAVTGSQKALSLPTGLALVCASDKVCAVGAGLCLCCPIGTRCACFALQPASRPWHAGGSQVSTCPAGLSVMLTVYFLHVFLRVC